MYRFATAIGIDIGRTTLRTAIVRYDGKVIATFDFPYGKHPDKETLLENVIDAVRTTRQNSIALKVNPLCVGVSAKGFIDRLNGIVLGPDQGIEGWKNIHLGKIIYKEIGLPAFVDNDANLMALAENSFGKSSAYSNIIFLTLRSGIGGAIIIDGQLYRGVENAAGEFGQMVVRPGVSLEQLASSVSLVSSYLSRSDKYSEGNPLPANFRAKDVFELSKTGDIRATEVIEENARYIGEGLANLISIFSPEIIVLGGGMSQAGDKYIKLIRESAYKRTLSFQGKNIKIEAASLGQSASLMGASLYALTRIDGKDI
jgi:glucokinase